MGGWTKLHFLTACCLRTAAKGCFAPTTNRSPEVSVVFRPTRKWAWPSTVLLSYFCSETLHLRLLLPHLGSQAWKQAEQSHSFSGRSLCPLLTCLLPLVSKVKPLESAWRELVSSKHSLPAHLWNTDADDALYVLHTTTQSGPISVQTQVGFPKDVTTSLFLFLASATEAWPDTTTWF